MSTDQKTVNSSRKQTLHRFAQLASLGEMVFHVSDLASLWQITERNTLHTTLSRYTKQKLLYRLWQGMYALKPAEQIDPLLLGIKAVHTYAYISTETVLFNSGIITQRPAGITLISSVSRRFSLGGREYVCRQLDDMFLYQKEGITEHNGVRMASPERAVADLLYYNPRAYFDAPLNWKEVQRIQKKVGYPLTSRRTNNQDT
jgi:predicted transcriptional regulator of viral defense system